MWSFCWLLPWSDDTTLSQYCYVSIHRVLQSREAHWSFSVQNFNRGLLPVMTDQVVELGDLSVSKTTVICDLHPHHKSHSWSFAGPPALRLSGGASLTPRSSVANPCSLKKRHSNHIWQRLSPWSWRQSQISLWARPHSLLHSIGIQMTVLNSKSLGNNVSAHLYKDRNKCTGTSFDKGAIKNRVTKMQKTSPYCIPSTEILSHDS